MSTVTSIATQTAAEAAVRNAGIVPIPSVKFSSETFRKFSRSITNAARAVPSLIGGGSHGHIFLTEEDLAYTARTGGTGYTETVHPGAIDFTGATTNTQIARVRSTRKRAHVLASASSSLPTSRPSYSWSWKTRSQG